MKKTTGHLHKRLEVTDKITKAKIHDDDTNERIGVVRRDGPLGTVRVVVGATLSMGYNSVRIDIGGELPFTAKPGDFEAYNRTLASFEEIVEERLGTKMKEMEELLNGLARRRG